MIPSEKWVGRFLEMAKLVASWSYDPSSKCGAVITRGKRIVSTGYNGFPAGTNDHAAVYANRDRKYLRVVHAEKNAILFAKQDLEGCTMYVTHFPCCQCAAFIIQSGINRVVALPQSGDFMTRWYDQIEESLNMFGEAEVKCYTYYPEVEKLTRFLLFDPKNIEDY